MFTDKQQQKPRRTSPQRTAILETLASTTSHPSAAWVYERVRERFPDISLGTVYRNLELLSADGKALTLRASDGIARFDADVSEHYHLECTVCGRVMDACPASDRRKRVDFADRAIERETGFRVTGHRLTYLGVCRECATAAH